MFVCGHVCALERTSVHVWSMGEQIMRVCVLVGPIREQSMCVYVCMRDCVCMCVSIGEQSGSYFICRCVSIGEQTRCLCAHVCTCACQYGEQSR